MDDSADRFWARVIKTPECWLWTRAKTRAGYGLLQVNGKLVYAHRYALQLNGWVPQPKQVVGHHCDNPPCVRPDHLFLGTQADNLRDMTRKGREYHGQMTSERRQRIREGCRRYWANRH